MLSSEGQFTKIAQGSTESASQRANSCARAFSLGRALRYVCQPSQPTTPIIPIQPMIHIVPPIFWSCASNPHCPNKIPQSWSPEPTSGKACARASAIYVPMYGKFSKNQYAQNAKPNVSRCAKKYAAHSSGIPEYREIAFHSPR